MSINILFVAALVVLLASLSRLLGPRTAPTRNRVLPYEAGMPPIEPAVEKMTVPYIRFALLFVLFDIETALLLPWVEARGALDARLMASASVFLVLLTLLLAYVWRKGALSWR